MLRNYDAELKQVAKTYGRKWLGARGMAMLEGLANRTDLTSDEALKRILVIVGAVQKLSQDESLPYNIENDPF